MEIIELRCDKSLGYGLAKIDGALDTAFLDNPDEVVIITASNLVAYDEKQVRYVNGTSRYFFDLNKDVFLYNVRSTSPFYANIFWDISHSLPVGKKLYIFEDNNDECIIDSDYYDGSFKKEIINKSVTVYEKTKGLLCEQSAGLDSWTFGIPVGPEDPVFLNYSVERILDLGFDDFEIILCGRPHNDFKYFDKVTIVGEDIQAPPVHITRKKNTIAEHATKKNLCIIHDRVLLPGNFKSAITRFGDFFPFVGFQSYYFTDYYNFVPRKYSDFNTLSKSISNHVDIEGFDRDSIKIIANNIDFYYQNPLRADFGRDYLTGSLYICKAELWKKYPQNEKLYWDDFEDIEYGVRTALMGIPSIINPYTITQSMNTRSIIHYYGYIRAVSKIGKVNFSRSITEILSVGKKKPLFKISEQEAVNRMLAFANVYANDEDVIRFISSGKLTGKRRLEAINKILQHTHVPVWEMKAFVDNFSRNILFEPMPPQQQKDLLEVLSSNISPKDKKNIILHFPMLNNQVSSSLKYSVFCNNENDWFSKKGLLFNWGCWISAFNIKFLSRCSYFSLSLKELKQVIYSTSMIKRNEK